MPLTRAQIAGKEPLVKIKTKIRKTKIKQIQSNSLKMTSQGSEEKSLY